MMPTASRFGTPARGPRFRGIVLTVVLALCVGVTGCKEGKKTDREPVAQKPEPSASKPQKTPIPRASKEPAPAEHAEAKPQQQPSGEHPPDVEGAKAEGKRVEYAPGVTIDFSVPQVEVAAKVALREGYIELFLCAQRTKEHESVLVTAARPRKIYEAIGLIGLEPGTPVSFDDATQQWRSATGAPLSVLVRRADADDTAAVPAHEWMITADDMMPLHGIGWVFAGSQETDGAFGADVEGTIVCVVDFATALIAPSLLHSASDQELWLVANKSAIPEVGTDCTVIIKAAPNPLADHPGEEGIMILTVTPEGYFYWQDRVLSALELDAIIRKRTAEDPNFGIELSAVPGTPTVIARFAAQSIIGSGVKADRMMLDLPPEPSPEESSPAAESSGNDGE